jgi:hypothetical protein
LVPFHQIKAVCVGGANTFSFGGLVGIPNAMAAFYSFSFNDPVTHELFLDSAAGILLPGQTKTFKFGEFIPDGVVPDGSYAFSTQLQFFAATLDRPLLDTSSFGGTFTVTAVPEPSTWAMMLIGFAGIGFIRYRSVKDYSR